MKPAKLSASIMAAIVAAVAAITPVHAQVSGGASAGFPGPEFIPLTSGLNANGSTLAATAAGASDFAVALTADASLVLNGHQASSNTKTDTVVYEITLPTWRGTVPSLHVIVYAKYTAVASSGAVTVAAKLQTIAADGTVSAALTRLTGAANQSAGSMATPLLWEFDTQSAVTGNVLLTITTTAGEMDGGMLTASLSSVQMY